MKTIIVDNAILTQYDDNSIRVLPITLAKKMYQITDSTLQLFTAYTRGNRAHDNRLITRFIDNKINIDHIISISKPILFHQTPYYLLSSTSTTK
jgi:hypothetical protein